MMDDGVLWVRSMWRLPSDLFKRLQATFWHTAYFDHGLVYGALNGDLV